MEGNWKSQVGNKKSGADIISCEQSKNYELRCNGERVRVLTNNVLKVDGYETSGKYDGNGHIDWSNGTQWTKYGTI